MTQGPSLLVCPKGHASSEPDYCSECGAKIEGAPPVPVQGTSGGTATAPEVCPDCGMVREVTGIAFCEVCGYNFNTGAHGGLSLLAASEAYPAMPPVESEPVQISAPGPAGTAEPLSHWAVVVSVDASLRRPESPAPPPDLHPFTVGLDHPVSLIGRTNEARGIFPEIALPFDDAVSRRHALLQKNDAGVLSLRDIGSANGTRLNGKTLDPMADTPLKQGDEITLGHWTRLTVQAGD